MNFRLSVFALSLSCFFARAAFAQGCGSLAMQEVGDISGACTKMNLCLRPDALGKPYAYLAQKEGGLIVESVAGNGLTTIAHLGIENFDSLDVMNITQQSGYLYVALGNHFGANTQTPGVAVVDVSDPTNPRVTSIYTYPAKNGGCGIVAVEGNYVLMGAMLHGLVILNTANKHALKYVSEIMPDRSFPAPNPDTSKYNARGIALRNSLAFLCFDAGGLRVIDWSDPANPREIGKYSAPEIISRPRAYNNVTIHDTLAYVAVDYCGMEVLSIADPTNPRRVGWWNPWHCEGPANNWFNSGGYANEIEYLPACKLAFLSCGRAPLEVVDVSDPAHPDSCSAYPAPINVGSWGISVTNDHVYLSYICALVPFVSASTGIKILSYAPCDASVEQSLLASDITLTPQPATDHVSITSSGDLAHASVSVFDALGKEVRVPFAHTASNAISFDVHALSSGTYFIRLSNAKTTVTKRFIKLTD